MKLAIFYHCLLTGHIMPIETEFACSILQEQMTALMRIGLLDAAEKFYVGLNGDEEAAQIARLFLPPKAKIIVHGTKALTEIPTLAFLRSWLPGHEDWKVIYFHMKSVSHPGEASYTNWRHRMEQAVILRWRECVAHLDTGMDACGCHWLTPEQYPGRVIRTPYFGGNFWWATAKYLLTLPPLPEDTYYNRFAAESWIGTGPSRPRVIDYCPGWP